MPSPRESMLYGKILFISVRGLLQATVILLIATLLGSKDIEPDEDSFDISYTVFVFSIFFCALNHDRTVLK